MKPAVALIVLPRELRHRYKAMTLTKIGTVGQRRSRVCGQPSGDGVMIRSCPLYPVGSSDGYRSVRERTYSTTYPHSYYNPHKKKETVVEELRRLLGNAPFRLAE